MVQGLKDEKWYKTKWTSHKPNGGKIRNRLGDVARRQNSSRKEKISGGRNHMNELTFAFVGAGGDGAVAAGDIIAVACAREGLHVIKTEAYGPQLRGRG